MYIFIFLLYLSTTCGRDTLTCDLLITCSIVSKTTLVILASKSAACAARCAALVNREDSRDKRDSFTAYWLGQWMVM